MHRAPCREEPCIPTSIPFNSHLHSTATCRRVHPCTRVGVMMYSKVRARETLYLHVQYRERMYNFFATRTTVRVYNHGSLYECIVARMDICDAVIANMQSILVIARYYGRRRPVYTRRSTIGTGVHENQTASAGCFNLLKVQRGKLILHVALNAESCSLRFNCTLKYFK